MLVLKLPPFFPSRVGEGKRAAISKQKQVRSYIVLALVNLVSTKGDLKVSVNLSYWLLLIFSYSIQFRKFLYSSLIVGFSLPFAHLFFWTEKKVFFPSLQKYWPFLQQINSDMCNERFLQTIIILPVLWLARCYCFRNDHKSNKMILLHAPTMRYYSFLWIFQALFLV